MEDDVRERVSILEVVLGEFIVQTNKSLNRLSREMKDFKDEMKDFKDEMKDFKDEMKDFKDEMKDFKDEMKDFKDEMKDFKDEMKDFKDEMATDRKSLKKKWGELANRLGTLAEDITAPNIRTIAHTLFGCEQIDTFGVRIERRNVQDRAMIQEFDVILACQQYLFINETKSNPDIVYVDYFVKKLTRIFDFFPEHQGKTVVPIFSSLSLPERTVAYLTEKNILAMAMGGETMDLLNFDILKSQWIE